MTETTTTQDKMADLLAQGEAEEGDYLINGKVYDPNTLSFKEMRAVRRVCRELFDGDGDYDAEKLSAQDVAAAIVYVFLMREKGADMGDIDHDTLDEALELRYHDLIVTAPKSDKDEEAVPPTSPASSKRSRAKSTPGGGGR